MPFDFFLNKLDAFWKMSIWDDLKNFELDEYDPYIPYSTVTEQQSAWYQENKERLQQKALDYLNENRDEVNRKRREARATEPYRSEYLAKQRERRRKKKDDESGSVWCISLLLVDEESLHEGQVWLPQILW